MTADTQNPDDPSDLDRILKTLEPGDRVLFNDRVKPLRVDNTRQNISISRDYYQATISGKQGGKYRLRYDRDTDTASLGRYTGETVGEYGLPKLDSIPLTSVQVVFHQEFTRGQVWRTTDDDKTVYVVVTRLPGRHDDTDQIQTVRVVFRDGELFGAWDRTFFPANLRDRIYEDDWELAATLPLGHGELVRDTDRDVTGRFRWPEADTVYFQPEADDVDGETLRWDAILPDGLGTRFVPVDAE